MFQAARQSNLGNLKILLNSQKKKKKYKQNTIDKQNTGQGWTDKTQQITVNVSVEKLLSKIFIGLK